MAELAGEALAAKEAAEAASREDDPSCHAEASELADRLRSAVGQLPRRQGEIFCLSCFEQMTSEEIAQRSGISSTAVRMMLSRARRRLQQLLAPRAGVSRRND